MEKIGNEAITTGFKCRSELEKLKLSIENVGELEISGKYELSFDKNELGYLIKIQLYEDEQGN